MSARPGIGDGPGDERTASTPPEPEPGEDFAAANQPLPATAAPLSLEPTLATRDVSPTALSADQTSPGSRPDRTSQGTTHLEPGQVVFDKYVVVRLLGQGGMGTVWLVRHRDLDVDRALKMIVSGVALHPGARARLKREARVMALFSHPNAVAVHDARMTDSAAFIEMEYVRGQPISTLLRPGVPMPLDWTVRILDQLCDVLQVAHGLGIVHRDLKPSNLMLVDGRPPDQPQLKVLDFGIAKLLGTDQVDHDELHTQTGMFIGTAPYSSPDQIAVGTVDGRSDIYSVGVILYELLTGYRPFSGPTTLNDHLHTPPPAFATRNGKAEVPPEIEGVVMRCLAKRPGERPQTASELALEFHRALEAAGPGSARLSHREGDGDKPARPETPAPAGGLAAAARGRFRVGLLAAGAALVLVAITLAALSRLPRGTSGYGNRASEASEPVSPSEAGRRTAGIAAGAPKASPTLLERGASGAPAAAPEAPPRFPPLGYEPDAHEPVVQGNPSVLIRHRDGARFHFIEGGSFVMGAPEARPSGADARPENEPGDDQPAHPVQVSAFYLQETEVTNGEMLEYFRFKATRPADWPENFRKAWNALVITAGLKEQDATRYPAVGVSQVLCREFAAWAGGRLPTEAEWEFAARSRGQSRTYVWGDRPEPSARMANIDTLGLNEPPTMPVGSYPQDRTEQGIVDLSGNVREWCLDAWQRYTSSERAQVNPLVARTSESQGHVIRGGSFSTDIDHGRTTYRSDFREDFHTSIDLGFRIVLEIPPAAASHHGP